MISKSLIKKVRSLEHKKYRLRERLFVAEGAKTVEALMEASAPEAVIATAEWYEDTGRSRDIVVTDDELRKVSFMQHPQQVAALFPLPDTEPHADTENGLVLALDGIQDPGNLGTIIRTADWFGVRDVVCSPDCADVYAPKAVQATMGSIASVRVAYCDLEAFITRQPAGVRIFGTFLNGADIYRQQLCGSGIIIMGNEGKGISPEVERLVSDRLTIPRYGQGHCETRGGNLPPDRKNLCAAESLNVATAAAIVCSEFRRRGA